MDEDQPVIIEGRSLASDIGAFAAPVIGAAAAWALNQYGNGSDDSTPQQPEEPKEIILPPGTDRDHE